MKPIRLADLIDSLETDYLDQCNEEDWSGADRTDLKLGNLKRMARGEIVTPADEALAAVALFYNQDRLLQCPVCNKVEHVIVSEPFPHAEDCARQTARRKVAALEDK